MSVSAATKTVLSIFVVVERLAAAVSSFVRTTAAAENPLSAIQSAAATAASTAARSSLIGAVALIGVVTALLSSWVNWCYTSAGTATLAALKWINHGKIVLSDDSRAQYVSSLIFTLIFLIKLSYCKL